MSVFHKPVAVRRNGPLVLYIKRWFPEGAEDYAESVARYVERREAYQVEAARLDRWARWPDPSMRFLAPIGVEELAPAVLSRREAVAPHLSAYIPSGEALGPEDQRG